MPHIRITRTLAALLAVTATHGAAVAGNGPLNTPVGTFSNGAVPKVAWLVPGALRKNGMITAVSCTSLEAAGVNVDIGVEFFDGPGNQLNAVATAPVPPVTCSGGILSVPAGNSVTIATTATAQFHEDCILGLGTFSGSARILSTSTKIACTARVEDSKSVILDPTGFPTGRTPSVTTLNIIKPKKQAGD